MTRPGPTWPWRGTSLSAGVADDALADRVRAATATLSAQRAVLNTDPLSLWRDSRADTSGAAQARQQAAGVAADVAAVARVRDSARQRVDTLAATAAEARAAWKEALAARQRAAEKIGEQFLPAVPAACPSSGFRRDWLDAIAAAGQWQRLSAEIDRAAHVLAAQMAGCRKAARDADESLSRRSELRGMLQAYKAKAARLGGAEDLGLTERYEAARDLLWTAPCDLDAAASAVAAYQQAILAIGRGQE